MSAESNEPRNPNARHTRSDREYRDRLSIVQRAMEEFGWSPRVKYKLAAQFGVSVRTVYEMRRKVLDEMVDDYQDVDFFARRAEFLNRLSMHQRSAANKSAFGPLSSMLGIEAKVVGLDKPADAQERTEPTLLCEVCDVDVFLEPCSHVLQAALEEARDRESQVVKH